MVTEQAKSRMHDMIARADGAVVVIRDGENGELYTYEMSDEDIAVAALVLLEELPVELIARVLARAIRAALVSEDEVAEALFEILREEVNGHAQRLLN